MGKKAMEIAAAVGAFLSIMWMTILFFPGGWQDKLILMSYRMDLGLFYGKAEWTLWGDKLEGQSGVEATGWLSSVKKEFTDWLNSMQGHHSTLQFQQVFCNIEAFPGLNLDPLRLLTGGCHMWNMMQTGSLTMLLCGVIGLLFFWASLGFGIYYTHVVQRRQAKKMAIILGSIALGLWCIGLMVYSFLALEFVHWPLWLCGEVMCFGWAWISAMLLLPVMIIHCLMTYHYAFNDLKLMEELCETTKSEKKEMMKHMMETSPFWSEWDEKAMEFGGGQAYSGTEYDKLGGAGGAPQYGATSGGGQSFGYGTPPTSAGPAGFVTAAPPAGFGTGPPPGSAGFGTGPPPSNAPQQGAYYG